MLAMSRVALALSLALPSVSVGQGFEYAPGTSRYRVAQTVKAVQEVMGQKQEFEMLNSQVMTVTLARGGRDTVAMKVVLDSITATGPMGPPPGVDRMPGMVFDAKLSPSGTVYSVVGPKDSTVSLVSSITESVRRFLPNVRRRLAAGASWADTSSGRLSQNGLEIDRKTFSRLTVAGDTTVAGERSWKIVRNDSTSLSGSGSQGGQALTMEGTAIGTGMLLVSQKGVFMGGQGDEVANLKIVLSGNGMEVGVTQTSNTKISKVN